MKYIQSNILRKMLFCLILLFLGLSNAPVTHAENYTFVTQWGFTGSFNGPAGIDVDSSGNVYVADYGNHRIQKFNSSDGIHYNLVTEWGSWGDSDGKFICPCGVAVDSLGNVYVADSWNDRIQKFNSSDGIHYNLVTKWGFEGSSDGKFIRPRGVAVDSSGNVYVADTYNHRIQKFSSSDGINYNFITYLGDQQSATSCSSGNSSGQFKYPEDVAVDSSGNVYVTDSGNNRIQKFNSSGSFIYKWGSRGSSMARFETPVGIAVDSSNYVYVSDSNNLRIQKFVGNGAFVTQWGGTGSDPGKFYKPFGIAVDSLGNVYVTDSGGVEYGNNRIQKFTLQKIIPTITWNNPTNLTYGTALSSIQLNAAASYNYYEKVSGTFVYNPPAGTVLSVGTQTLHVDFTPTDTTHFTTASKDVTINVLKATPKVYWKYPNYIFYGTPLNSTQLNAAAAQNNGNEVFGTFVYNPASGTVLSAGTQTLHVDFTPMDATNYTTASKDVTILVHKVTPTVTWNNPADIVYGTALNDTQLNATALVSGTFNYTPPSGTILDVGTQILHVDFTPTDTANYIVASKNVTINVLENDNIKISKVVGTYYKCDSWSDKQYPLIDIFGEKDVPLFDDNEPIWKCDVDKLAKRVLDSGDMYTLKTGDKLDLGQGYSLEAKQVDVDGKKVWLEFSKDGQYIDDTIVSTDTGDKTWTYILNNIQNVTNVPVLKVHVNQVFQGAEDSIAQIDGIWLIDFENATTHYVGDEFGNYTLIKINYGVNESDLGNLVFKATQTATITVDKATPTIVWNNPADIIYGTALNSTQLNATASVSGNFRYTPEIGTILDVGTQILHVDFTPTDAANYTTASKNVTINVSDIKIFKVAGTYYNCSNWSNKQYPVINLFGEKYVPLDYVLIWNCDLQKLAKLVLDNNFSYVLKNGEQLDLGQGYSLTAKQIDVDGKRVWLEFDKDGQYVDDEIINVGTDDSTWNVELDDIQGEDDIPVLKVHVNEIFQGLVDGVVQINGIWLIDYANATTLMVGGQFGNYTIMEVNNGLNESNPGNLVFKKTTSLP